MVIDSIACQKKISMYGLIFASLFTAVALVFGQYEVVGGIIFGTVLNAINYWVVAAIFRAAFGTDILMISKTLLFAFYQIRFLVMAVILFVVIINFGSNVGVGTFLGFLAIKIGMGVVVLSRLATDKDGV